LATSSRSSITARPLASSRRSVASPRNPGEIYQAIFQTTVEEDYDSGRLSTAAFIERLRVDLDLQASDAEIARAWNDIYSPNTAVIGMIHEIGRRGVRLILASNTNELHYRWFRPLFAPTLDRFDHEVLSFRIGCRKPDPRFFQACLRACSPSAPEGCLYIDDREDFIAAAGALGIRGIAYRPGTEPAILDMMP
jgi:putative hydrolase of the HAD superfamily